LDLKSKQIQEFQETEIGKIPVDWEIKKLGEVTLLITDGKHGDCENQENSGYYFLSAKDVIDGKLQYSSARQITKNDFDEVNKRTSLEIGDVLITNSGTIGRLAIAQHPEKTKKTTFQKSVAIIKTKKTELNNLFLYYFLLFSKKILSETIAGGTSQPNLLLGDLRSFLIPLPPLEYQIQISKNLSTLDSKIQNLQNQNHTLEQTAQAIFKSWFVDFDGVTEFEDSELGQIPKGWSIKSIKEIVSKKKYSIVDGPFGTQLHNDEYVSEGIPVVKVKNLSFNGTFLDNSFSYITEEKFNYLIRSAVYPGDILLAKTGNTIGKFSMLPSYINRALIASSNLKISPNPEKFNKFYIYNIIQNLTKIDYWNNISAGSTRPTITLSDVRNIDIIYPNDQIMKKYFLLVEPLYNLKEKNIISLYSLTKTRDALLPKLMSGEIRV
jgi:type I restriction enzyme, S subunit